MIRRNLQAFVLAAWLGVLAGCAHSSRPASGPDPGIPAGSPLARIQPGMMGGQVQQILGQPTSVHSYATGKVWIPFYFGPDYVRQEWRYRGLGRVVLTAGRMDDKVISVKSIPQEPGY